MELKPPELIGVIRRRAARLEKMRDLCTKGIDGRRNAMLRKEREVVDEARLILSTLTNAYFSPLMENQRFDVVVVEEASMAVLPALFYAACLGYRKTIMVGDPCQLPSIVQSDAEYVRKVMGRNIFEVAVKDPLSSPLVAMLDTQYRMHPSSAGWSATFFIRAASGMEETRPGKPGLQGWSHMPAPRWLS